MSLRIAIALHDFSLGGTERIAIRLANQWAADGAAVSVFAGSAGGELRGMLDDNVELIVAKRAITRRWRSTAQLGRWIRSELRDHPADVLFVPGNFHWPVAWAVRGLKRRDRPIVVAQVSNVLRKRQRGPVRQRLFEARVRRQLHEADAIVTMGEEDQRLAATSSSSIAGTASTTRSTPPCG